MKAKTVSESRSVSTDLVLPNETNHYGNMFGGELLARMDRVGTIAAVRHSGCVVVTAAVNSVSFNKIIPQGSVVTVEASLSRAFTSSMEEKERYEGALRRKQLSLVLAGRIKPHDATELQALFQDLENQ